MTTDDEQLRILSIFHYIVAAVAGLFSLLPIFHITMGGLMMAGRLGSQDDPTFDRLFGLLFVLMGTAFLLAGFAYAVCMALAGRYLSERRHYVFCLVMAALSCAFVPFGTILGVFTIITLQKDPVRLMFANR